MSVNKELAELKNDFVALKTEVTGWMSTTTEYRKNLCAKVDIITERVSQLPCKERRTIYDSVKKQMAFLWCVTGAIVLAIIAEWVKKK